jgi:hypothetical protein
VHRFADCALCTAFPPILTAVSSFLVLRSLMLTKFFRGSTVVNQWFGSLPCKRCVLDNNAPQYYVLTCSGECSLRWFGLL